MQFAKLAGAGAVVAVRGEGKENVVRQLGATEVVDYTRPSIEEWVAVDAASEVDLVVDMVGGQSLTGCWRLNKTSRTGEAVEQKPFLHCRGVRQ